MQRATIADRTVIHNDCRVRLHGVGDVNCIMCGLLTDTARCILFGRQLDATKPTRLPQCMENEVRVEKKVKPPPEPIQTVMWRPQ